LTLDFNLLFAANNASDFSELDALLDIVPQNREIFYGKDVS